ncbi:MAG: hypothetical protein MEQ74_14845 [Paracoccus sp.]|nr:hypothetical protein [Paracoccus sp. (in: a-proteobacteria)]
MSIWIYWKRNGPLLAGFLGSVLAGGALAQTQPQGAGIPTSNVTNPALLENYACEMRAAGDGSLEEYTFRSRAQDLENDVRERGLLDNALGESVLDTARLASGCEPVAAGANVCETLENHRYSNVDPECRRLLLFEADRLDPLTYRVPQGDDPLAWAMVAAIALQVDATRPSLKDGEIRPEIDETVSNPFVGPVVMKFVEAVLITYLANELAKGLDAAAKATGEGLRAREWSGRAEPILRDNARDLETIRLERTSIETLENMKIDRTAKLLEENDRISLLEKSGTISPQEAEAQRTAAIASEERDRQAVNEAIAKREANIVNRAEDIQERSEDILKEIEPEIEEACEQVGCSEQEFDFADERRFEQEVAFCKARYNLDDTIALPAASGGLSPVEGTSSALAPRCNIETFERIMSNYTDKTRTLSEVFGGSGEAAEAVARNLEETRDAQDGYDDAVRAHEAACKLTPDTCACREAEARLDRASERLYPTGMLFEDLARLYVGGDFGLPLQFSPVTEPTETTQASDACKPGAKFIVSTGEDGKVQYRLVMPGDEDYPVADIPSWCDPRRAFFRDLYTRTVTPLGSVPNPPQVTAEMIDAIAAAVQPLGATLIEKQRRAWQPDDSCGGGPTPIGGQIPVLPTGPALVPGLPPGPSQMPGVPPG